MLTPVTLTLQAGEAQNAQIGPLRFFKIISVPAGATVMCQTVGRDNNSAFFEVVQNNWARTTGPAWEDLRFESSIGGDITLIWSVEDELRSDILGVNLTGPFDVNVLNEVDVQGPDAYETTLPIGNLGNPFPGAMLLDNNDATFTVKAFKTIDGSSLLVGKENIVFPFLASPGIGIDVRMFRTMRISFIGGTKGGADLNIGLNDGTPTCAVFKEDGTYVSLGVIPGVPPAGEETYLVSVGGSETVYITSADPTWNFGIGLCPDFIVP